MASDLQVTTTPRPNSRLALEVVVPAERSRQSYDAALKKLCRTTRLPGFRPGRVPATMLLKQLGTRHVHAAALEALLETTVRDTLERDDLHLLGQPELKQDFESLLEQFTPGEVITFSFESDVEPTPTLRTYTGLTVAARVADPDPARVDRVIERQRRRQSTLVPVEDRAAAAGDIAVINAQGRFADDNSAIPRGSFKGQQVELPEEFLAPGFTEGLIGMMVGSSTSVTITFPDESMEELRGREAIFDVELLELKKRELPELNDDFAVAASGEESLAAWRHALQQEQEELAVKRTSELRQEALMEVLAEQLVVDIPEVMIENQKRLLLRELAAEMARVGVDMEKYLTSDYVQQLEPTVRDDAVQHLKHQFVLQVVADDQNIQVPQEEVNTEVLKTLKQFGSNSRKVDQIKLRKLVKQNLLEEKVLNWLENHNTFTVAVPSETGDTDLETGDRDVETAAGAPAAEDTAASLKPASMEDAGSEEMEPASDATAIEEPIH